MIETDNWKGEHIGDYRALSAMISRLETEIKEDVEVQTVDNIISRLHARRKELIQDRERTIFEAKEEQYHLKQELLEHWDIDRKSFRCEAGGVTLRTTKKPIIDNKAKVIETLYTLGKLEDAILQFKTSEITTLKKVGLIPDDAMHFENTTVAVITEPKNGSD